MRKILGYTLVYFMNHIVRQRQQYAYNEFVDCPRNLKLPENFNFKQQNLFMPYMPEKTDATFNGKLENELVMAIPHNIFEYFEECPMFSKNDAEKIKQYEIELYQEIIKRGCVEQKIPFITNMEPHIMMEFLEKSFYANALFYNLRDNFAKIFEMVSHICVGINKKTQRMEAYLYTTKLHRSPFKFLTSMPYEKSQNDELLFENARIFASRIYNALEIDLCGEKMQCQLLPQRNMIDHIDLLLREQIEKQGVRWAASCPAVNENKWTARCIVINTTDLHKLSFLNKSQKNFAKYYDQIAKALVFRLYDYHNINLHPRYVHFLDHMQTIPMVISNFFLLGKNFPFDIVANLANDIYPNMEVLYNCFTIFSSVKQISGKQYKITTGLFPIFPFYAYESNNRELLMSLESDNKLIVPVTPLLPFEGVEDILQHKQEKIIKYSTQKQMKNDIENLVNDFIKQKALNSANGFFNE